MATLRGSILGFFTCWAAVAMGTGGCAKDDDGKPKADRDGAAGASAGALGTAGAADRPSGPGGRRRPGTDAGGAAEQAGAASQTESGGQPGGGDSGGGQTGTGGQTGSDTGGQPTSGGQSGSGGRTGTGGQPGTGGQTGTGGRAGSGGQSTSGGGAGSGGQSGSGGQPVTGGQPGTGATSGSGGGPTIPLETASCEEAFAEGSDCPEPTGRIYYVSSSSGLDTNDGLSEEQPIASISAVNALELAPGDQVLFKCGDSWEREQLIITESGTECSHIVFGSYPRVCEDQPIISGSLPVEGWSDVGGGIWEADLDAGDFPDGMNQLFRDNVRLPLSRWPEVDDPAFDGGYSFMDDNPEETVVIDNELPDVDWSGAVFRYKPIRWNLLNRLIVSSNGTRLNLNSRIVCWGESPCGPNDDGHGWGYYLANHRAAMDREGEWAYDREARKVWIYSGEQPANITASYQILDDEGNVMNGERGGVVIGHMGEGDDSVSYVVVENLRLENWAYAALAYPLNMYQENHHLVIRCNTIHNPEGIGLELTQWAGDPSAGWRGGHDLVVTNNVIEGANYFGIHTYAHDSLFQENVIRNTGMLANLNIMGLGCDFEQFGCTANGSGIHIDVGEKEDTSYGLMVRRNRIEGSGFCGIQLYGGASTFEENYIERPTSTKGDGGGICTYGGDTWEDTPLVDVVIRRNILVDIIGNADGCNQFYSDNFAFAVAADYQASNLTTEENTIIRPAASGILYQDATGTVRGNVIFEAGASTYPYGSAMDIHGEDTLVTLSGNVMHSVVPGEEFILLRAVARDTIAASDSNVFFNAYNDNAVESEGYKTLSEWQDYSGFDANSSTAWFTQAAGEESRTIIVYNDTFETRSFPLDGSYVTVHNEPVGDSIELEPFTSQILVRQ